MSGLSDEELAAIEARAAAAGPGPWQAWVEGRDGVAGDDVILRGPPGDRAEDLYVFYGGEPMRPADPADLDFIAHARQDVPRLVAEIRRLRGGD